MKATIILVPLVVIVVAVRRVLRRVGRHDGSQHGEVRYHVPAGQDPAAVLGALRVEGVPARPEAIGGESDLVISLAVLGGRERVREIVCHAPQDMEGDPRAPSSVTFTGEV